MWDFLINCLVFPFQLILLATALYILFKKLPCNTKTEVLCFSSPQNDSILSKLGSIEFNHTFYLPHAYAQLYVHSKFPRQEIFYKREYLRLQDGGVISLDWHVRRSCSHFSKEKLLILVHGLTGGSETNYMRELCNFFGEKENYSVVVIHNRGVSDTPLFTPFLNHAAYTNDVEASLDIIRERYPAVPCFILGVSMGANMLSVLFASSRKFDDYIKGFVSVSNPLNLLEAVKKNKGNVIDYFFHKKLKQRLENFAILRNVTDIDFETLKNTNSTVDLDERVTIKFHKQFKDIDDYYNKASSIYYISKIRIKSLFLNAKDDLVSPVHNLDLSAFKKNKNLIMLLTQQGCHGCWFEGVFSLQRWYLNMAKRFFDCFE